MQLVRRVFCVLVVFIISGIASDSAIGSPTQWRISEGGNDHWYEVVWHGGDYDWFEARDAAAEKNYSGLNGHLVTITSESENQFVWNLLLQSNPNQHDISDFFLGGYQLSNKNEPTGNWAWVTGEAFVYQNWLPGQPDDDATQPGYPFHQDFLHFWATTTGQWDDAGYTGVGGYILEYDTLQTDSPNHVPEGWGTVNGAVYFQNTPLCAMFIVNGQHVFTCDGKGSFAVDAPLDSNQQFTLQIFGSGFEPYRKTINSNESIGLLIELSRPVNLKNIQVDTSPQPIDAKFCRLSGTVTYNGGSVCAMVLANGQYAFTCSGDGSFDLQVPFDSNGDITLHAFCSGKQPYRSIIDRDQIGLDLDADGDGFSISAGDCNDLNPKIHPSAQEQCGDGVDQDCNGSDLECEDNDTACNLSAPIPGPSKVNTDAGGVTSIDFSWTPVPNAHHYVVRIGNDIDAVAVDDFCPGDMLWVTAGCIARWADSTSFTDFFSDGVNSAPSGTYHWTVTAICDNQEQGEWSDVQTIGVWNQ